MLPALSPSFHFSPKYSPSVDAFLSVIRVMEDDLSLDCLTEDKLNSESLLNGESLLSSEPEYCFRYCLKKTVGTQTDFEGKPKKGKRARIGTKVERCDKYWFRGFRAYLKEVRPEQLKKEMAENKAFWLWYFSKEGKPETSSQYISYNRAFRGHMLKSASFQRLFRDWMLAYGFEELSRKHGDTRFGSILREYGSKLIEPHEEQ